MLKRKGSHDALPTVTGARQQAGSRVTLRSIALTAALFVAVFTVVSVSRLNSGGAMPDTRASHGGDGALDRAAAAAAATATATPAATAQRLAAVPLPEESADSLKDRHKHVRKPVHADKTAASGPPQGLFALTANDVRGKPVPLAKFSAARERRTKAVLVINTASKCGYTKANFEGLVAMHKKYASFGFEVLNFPSNSFKQEPLEGEELEAWARETYGATFPTFQKAPVTGPQAQPVFKWIREQLGGGSKKEVVTWNFWKFLVDGRTGEVVRSYGMAFDRAAIEHDVYALLTDGELDDGGEEEGEGGGDGDKHSQKAAV